jgi:hypothetical protein
MKPLPNFKPGAIGGGFPRSAVVLDGEFWQRLAAKKHLGHVCKNIWVMCCHLDKWF